MKATFRVVSRLALVACLAGCGGEEQEAPTSPEPPSSPTPSMKDPALEARLEKIRQALAEGLDVNLADGNGRTPLMMAAFDGDTAVIELLLTSGAEVGKADVAGRTALMYAATGPFPETVELLLARGADVNRADTAEGWTALMLAASEGLRPVVEVLLAAGAEIERTDFDGDTALDHARTRGQDEMVEFLASRLGDSAP